MTGTGVQGPTVVLAEGTTLARVHDATYPSLHQGLSRRAFTTADAALQKTTWATGHRRCYALVDGDDLLASASQHDLTGVLDGRAIRICAIGALWGDTTRGGVEHAGALIERLVESAPQRGADLALVLTSAASAWPLPSGFEPVPTRDLELTVAESSRHGAPMTLVRGGEDRDLAAIAAMGQVRAARSRFHLRRDVDFVKHGITRARLLAGLTTAGARQLVFVIAEEGITAAAYAVISIAGISWTIEECGDRDPSGARVGAILQALIAREPGERRPVIRGWLPPGFIPPQVTIVADRPSAAILMARRLTAGARPLALASDDVLYWRSDLF